MWFVFPQIDGLGHSVSFDRDGIPIVAYHKYDTAGKSQVYVARPAPVTLTWKVVQLTNSNMTWAFSGSGVLPPGGSVANFFVVDDHVDGLVTIATSFVDASGVEDPTGGNYTLDEATLANLPGTLPNSRSYASGDMPQAINEACDQGEIELNTASNKVPAKVI